MYCFKNALDNWVWAEYQNKLVANQQKRGVSAHDAEERAHDGH